MPADRRPAAGGKAAGKKDPFARPAPAPRRGGGAPRGGGGGAGDAAPGGALEELVDRRVEFGEGERARFEEDGYVLMPRLLSRRGVQYLRERVDEVHRGRHPGVDDEWILNLHQVLPASQNWMWALATDPTVLDMVEDGLGPGVQLYASQLHRKAPGSGRAVPFHQDGGERGRTVWICLDEVDSSNGGLVVLPGWHKKGRMPMKKVMSEAELEPAEYFASHNVFEVDLKQASTMPPTDDIRTMWGVTNYVLPAGGAGMHHPFLPHSSPPNGSKSRERRIIILRYMAAGEPSAQGKIPHWHTGELFERKTFTATRGAPPPQQTLPEAQ